LRKITILEKIYRNQSNAKRSLREMLDRSLKVGVEVVSVGIGERGWATVSLEGEDEIVAERYVEEHWGRTCDLSELHEGDIRRGKIVDLGNVGYGIYVDVGVFDEGDSPVDVLLPAYSLKKHLGVRGSISVKALAGRLGLLENFPLDTRIFKIDEVKLEVEGRLTNSQARRIGRGRHRFYVCGETRRKIKYAIQKTGNAERVVRTKRLGLLETEVQCSKDSDPYEIIRQIGPMLNADIAVCGGL